MDGSAKEWCERAAFAGFDWAYDHHDVVVEDQQGTVVDEFRFDETADGWKLLNERLSRYPAVAVAIETSSGVVVERLLDVGYAVYPVNPKAAKRYRERKVPSGTKTDRVDAWSLADALRMDGHSWRPLKPDHPLTLELRLLCRDEITLIEQRTALICQLRAALHEYYPTALQAFDDWTSPASWAFIERFPTPQVLASAGRRKWEKFLHTFKLYHSEKLYAKRLELFGAATQFCGSSAITNAKSLLAVTMSIQLRVLQKQLDQYRAMITKLFAQHPDHDLFGSLPGVGEKLGPRLLAKLGDDRDRFESAESLQCYAGTAPVSYQSGQIHRTRFRRACQKTLRFSVHLWANLSRATCPWAEAYYRKKRKEGKSHACALRCLGQRWLKILWKMWQTRTRYDAELHQRNQVGHGSWVIALLPTVSE
ncbi:MAG: IS110 family transposase [Planctomycetes bacterium]|nr:IS110 family transposase [Planctomycetota bacterium]MBI3833201.1 IS110 family transposase [Planctomycetota bacterium]